MTNEKHELSFTQHSTTTKNDFKKKFVSTNIEQSQSNQEVKNDEKNYVFLKILDKFERFKEKIQQVLKKMRN